MLHPLCKSSTQNDNAIPFVKLHFVFWGVAPSCEHLLRCESQENQKSCAIEDESYCFSKLHNVLPIRDTETTNSEVNDFTLLDTETQRTRRCGLLTIGQADFD